MYQYYQISVVLSNNVMIGAQKKAIIKAIIYYINYWDNFNNNNNNNDRRRSVVYAWVGNTIQWGDKVGGDIE